LPPWPGSITILETLSESWRAIEGTSVGMREG
jgi:hypothetical protein